MTGRNGQGSGRVWPAGAGARFCDTTQRNSALALVDGPADGKFVSTQSQEGRLNTGRRPGRRRLALR